MDTPRKARSPPHHAARVRVKGARLWRRAAGSGRQHYHVCGGRSYNYPGTLFGQDGPDLWPVRSFPPFLCRSFPPLHRELNRLGFPDIAETNFLESKAPAFRLGCKGSFANCLVQADNKRSDLLVLLEPSGGARGGKVSGSTVQVPYDGLRGGGYWWRQQSIAKCGQSETKVIGFASLSVSFVRLLVCLPVGINRIVLCAIGGLLACRWWYVERVAPEEP